MTFPTSALIIIIVAAFAFYLIYSQNQNNQLKLQQLQQFGLINQPSLTNQPPCQNCDKTKLLTALPSATHTPAVQTPQPALTTTPALPNPHTSTTPNITNINIDNDNDPYSDPIKKQDLYSMYDPLTYPQLRLPREVLEKYNEYYEKNGTHAPFYQATQPLFDNPILNGVLIKQVDENEPFTDNIPFSVPLMRVKSSKNTNRFFYYIIDQRYLSKIEPKIPLDHVKINNIKYNNADFYGLPELYDGDIIENIPVYPNTKFKVKLYKTYNFP